MTNSQRVAKDDLERQVIHNIAEYGWHAVNVIEDNGCPPWTFSIGLYEGSSSGRAVHTSLYSRGDGGPEARLRSASRILRRSPCESVVTSM
jgi:hypothetical protein